MDAPSSMYEILIVDDEQNDLALMKLYLKRAGVPLNVIRQCFSGLEAVEYLTKAAVYPKLIITDYDMHPMNGVEFYRYLKKHRVFRQIPCIRITGRYTYEDVRVDYYKDDPNFSANLRALVEKYVL